MGKQVLQETGNGNGGGATATVDRDTHGQGATSLIKDSGDSKGGDEFGGPKGDDLATAWPLEDLDDDLGLLSNISDTEREED